LKFDPCWQNNATGAENKSTNERSAMKNFIGMVRELIVGMIVVNGSVD